MNKNTVEWTDFTWPVVNGCRRISAGCGTGREGGCYAERLAATRLKHTDRYRGLAVMTEKGPQWTGETRLIEKELAMPLKLRKPSRIFVADMGDLFYERVPFEVIDRVFAVMLLAPRHTYQCLTKRPERMREYLAEDRRDAIYAAAREVTDRYASSGRGLLPGRQGLFSRPIDTYGHLPWWIGTSVEDQKTADERIPELLRAASLPLFGSVPWVSAEPLLAAIDLRAYLPGPAIFRAVAHHRTTGHRCGGHGVEADCEECRLGFGPEDRALSWVVTGSESGPRARPANLDWFRSLRDQCTAVGAAYFFKQWAVNGRKQPVPELDGRQWMQFPEVRRVA